MPSLFSLKNVYTNLIVPTIPVISKHLVTTKECHDHLEISRTYYLQQGVQNTPKANSRLAPSKAKL